MAPADQAEDYQISKRVVREIHRGPVWASRSPIPNCKSATRIRTRRRFPKHAPTGLPLSRSSLSPHAVTKIYLPHSDWRPSGQRFALLLTQTIDSV